MTQPATLDASVGGMLELHYSHWLLGPIYPIRLAVTAFDPSPSGWDNDYLYTGGAGFTPGETGILATFAALAACWAPYYNVAWSIVLAQVYQNVGGLPVPLSVVPTAGPVNGATGWAAPPVVGKRAIYLYSTLGARWRVWLRQLAVAGIGDTVGVGTSTGGLDTRDRAWYVYASSPACAVVGRDGRRLQPGGKVRAWWDTPPAPYLVSG